MERQRGIRNKLVTTPVSSSDKLAQQAEIRISVMGIVDYVVNCKGAAAWT